MHDFIKDVINVITEVISLTEKNTLCRFQTLPRSFLHNICVIVNNKDLVILFLNDKTVYMYVLHT